MSRGKELALNGKEIVKTASELAIMYQIFNSKKAGKSLYDIAIELGLSVAQVRKELSAAITYYQSGIKERIQEEMAIDAARIDDLLMAVTPVAMRTSVPVTRTNARGEAYTDDEWKHCLSAVAECRQLIDQRAKLFGYAKTEVPQSVTNNHAFFLSSEKAFIDSLISAQPSEGPDPVIDVSFDP
jgi:hypothetical protein